MVFSGNDIADVVLKLFDSLPSKRKPAPRTDGAREWTILSGIVAEDRGILRCVALATGMKCLPRHKVSMAKGIVLHDWHAEVLAKRALNMFLLEECLNLLQSPGIPSSFVYCTSDIESAANGFPVFSLRPNLTLHMYCSEAPCGDASMEIIRASQEDDTPWSIPPASTNAEVADTATSELLGRGHFSQIGIVRRKPSRADAPMSLSKSCSDKLAMSQCTSLLSSITSLLISPFKVYLSSLVLPSSQYSATGCLRAFSPDGRMKELVSNDWRDGYGYEPFDITTTDREFVYSRRSNVLTTAKRYVASNLAAWWTPNHQESLIGGVMQGRKQFDFKGASRLCKAQMWKLALRIALLSGAPIARHALHSKEYRIVKKSALLQHRQAIKTEVRGIALKPWVCNDSGDDFLLPGNIIHACSESKS